ncbi:MAG: ERCC4 domain-containing protein [archaeon]
MKIIVDKHEKNSLVISELIGENAEVELKSLDVADYIIDDIAIERKTVSDFISSMLNRRLFRQIDSLKQCENRILIIEGIDEQELYNDSANSGIHANAVRGMILSIILKSKIPVLMTKDYKDTARFLVLIAKRCDKKESGKSVKLKRKAINVNEQQQMILEGFPGIGPAIAKELLKKFGTINAVINAELHELEKIKKLGKKASVIKDLADRKYIS